MLKKSISLLIFFLIFNFFIVGSVFSADGPDQTVINNLNKQLQEQQKKIDQIVDKIEQYKATINKVQGEATTYKNQVLILDNQIAKTNLDIEAKQEEIKQTELQINKVQLEIKRNEQEISKNKVELASFIRLLARYNDKNYLSVLLSNNSFSDFFDQIKYGEDLQRNIQKALNKTKELVNKLSKQKEDLESKNKQLSGLLEKLQSSKDALADQKIAKNYLIIQSQQSEKKFQTIVSDLKKAQNSANSQIVSIERKLREELSKKGGDEKLNSLSNAVLSWPTVSKRLTSTFYDPTYPYRNLFEHSGIDIGIKTGTPVMAAEAGYVAKAAIGTKWYGNYVMIIHSNNLSTLYGHLNSIVVQEDKYVSKGQIIGYSGSTGFSSGPHLHFEVRSNGIPTDPLKYLP